MCRKKWYYFWKGEKMFKNLKLRSKILGGFFTVLFLTALIGYIGFNSQKKIVAINDKVGDVNQLVNYAKDCRQQEKNFMLRSDKKYVDQLHETMTKICEQVTLTMAKFKDQADRDGLAKVENSAKEYKANFDNWVQLWDQQKTAEQAMLDTARAFSENAKHCTRSRTRNTLPSRRFRIKW
jgi:methyl-accepting chemotaxis protein